MLTVWRPMNFGATFMPTGKVYELKYWKAATSQALYGRWKYLNRMEV